jgi:hypothetical protein
LRLNPYLRILLALCMAASMWFYVQRILIPHQKAEAAARGTPRGTLSDLYPRWYGARELLLQGRDPYSSEVTAEIQQAYYGRELDSQRPADPKDEQRFAYPLYVVFVLAPSVHLPFETVRAMAFCTLATLAGLTVLLWFRFLGWKPSRPNICVALLLTLGSFPVVQGLKLEQLTLMVGGLLAGVACLAAADYLVWAGILLAAATIKPQLSLMTTVWLMIWVLGNWRGRQKLLWSFLAAMSALFAGSEWLLPGWLSEFVSAAVAYQQYTGGQSVFVVLTGSLIGNLLNVAAGLAVLVVAWNSRHAEAGSPGFAFATALALAVTVAVVPMMAPYNQVLLLLAVLLAARQAPTGSLRASQKLAATRLRPLARLTWVLCAGLLCWPWLVTIALAATAPLVGGEALQRLWWLPDYPAVVFPVAMLALMPALAPKVPL